jgi:hypothetical protein
MKFPDTFSYIGTGGNCTAFFSRIDDNHHLLVTDGEANAPKNFPCYAYLFDDSESEQLKEWRVNSYSELSEVRGAAIRISALAKAGV